MTANHRQILANISRYISLDTWESEFFCSLLVETQLKKKEFLLRAGTVCRFESFVLRGCLRQFYTDGGGQEHSGSFLPENWWGSDRQSLLSEQPALFSLQAVEPTVILRLERTALNRLYVQVPKFERFFRMLYLNAYIAQQNRIVEGLSLDTAQRYAVFLKRYPGLANRLPVKHLASYLGITPEFLSLIRRRGLQHKPSIS